MLRLLFCFLSLATLGTHAAPVSLQFSTTIDATRLGGSANTPLVVTYSFEGNLSNGTGPFAPHAGSGSYGPARLQVKLGNQSVSATGGGITVGNNVGGTDEYDVRGENFSGTLFGRSVKFFRFLIVDAQATMFDGVALPISAEFATSADFQQTDFGFADDSTLATTEFADTPVAERRPFTLVKAGTNPAQPKSVAGRYVGTLRHTVEIAAEGASASNISKITGRVTEDGRTFLFRPDGRVVAAQILPDGTARAQLESNVVLSGTGSFAGRTLKFSVSGASNVSGQLATFERMDTYVFTLTRAGN